MQTIYYGGNILTMEEEHTIVESILIEDGRIKHKGSLQEVEKKVQMSQVEKVNLKGKTLMPSFIDPHGHISFVGPVSRMADLSGCENFEDVKRVLSQYIEQQGDEQGEVIIGFGYDHTILEEGQHPTKEVLNQVTEQPVFVFHASAHMGCANDALLQMAGVDSETEEVEGGTIGRMADSMEPNGYVEETSLSLIQPYLQKGMELDYLKLVEEGQDVYIQNGITTVQDGAATPQLVEVCKALAEQDRLVIDVVSYPLMDTNPNEIFKSSPLHAKQYHKRFKLGGYKMFLDGSPQGKTAWLTEPYEGEETYRGSAWYNDEQVKQFTKQAVQDNVQLLTHCNGDAAADQLLGSYKAALAETEQPEKEALRPVMIHCQTVRDDQLDEMNEIGMIPSMFIDHTYFWGDVHLRNLGEERGHRISPAKSAIERGLPVNFHQDAPVIKPDMLQTIWSAVNRKTRTGITIGAEQRITIYEALQAVTIHAAYQYGEEEVKGSLKQGKLADLVILDKNPLQVDPMEIKDIQIEETIKEGRTLYRKKEL
ncbi:amidohydrolase [Halobacillus litoralis]|uniref:amidohydrolase n=1 Tax=Halobacillus litoralis TaxID=45668 RepID=UPI00136C7D25|nr:amidohydrolase [Halobacillus litoralis]MYL37020.1 amidohydrolase family protein [Halobacillus litoralis]